MTAPAMRLAYLGAGDNPHLLGWARWAVAHGHRVAIVSPSEPAAAIPGVEWIAPRWTPGLNALAFGLFRHRRSREVFFPRAIAPVLRPWKPDLVQGFDALFYGWAAVRSVPNAIKVVEPFGSDIFQGPGLGRVERWLLRRAFAGADGVTCNFPGIGAYVAERFGVRPPVVRGFSWGIDLAAFPVRGAGGEAAIRARLGVPADATVVLNPRGIRAYNGRDNLGALDALEAFARVAREVPPLHYVFLAASVPPELDAAWRAALDRLGPLRDRVTIVGERLCAPDMAALYRASDILLSVPWTDLMSLCVIEGAASGCWPVIAGCPDFEPVLVREQGLHASVVRAADVDSIAEGLRRGVASLSDATAWSATNRTVIERHHDARMQRELLDGFYAELAARRA